jgi:outer membrane protein
MKIKKTIPGVLLIYGILHASAQDTTMYLSLKQSCQLGIEKNVNVQNADLERQKTNYKLKEAQSKLYPQIEGYSTFSYYYAIPKMVLPGEIFGQTGMIPVEIGTKYDWSSGFKASQVLYSQSYFTSLKLAQRMVTIGDLSLQQKKEEVIFQVSQVYYLCQTTSKQIAQLKITMQNTERMIEIAKLQNENGIIRKIDYSRVSVNKSNLQTQIDNLDQLYWQQLGLLKYLIGLEMSTKIELSDSLTFSAAEISNQLPDLSNRTELKLLDKQMEITALTRKFNQQSYMPTLAGFGQYYYHGQRNAFDFFNGGNDKFFKTGAVGISLNVPIFDGFEKQSKTRQKDIELQQLQNTKKNTSDYFSKEFTDAARQYDNSLKALFRQQENIKVAEETYTISVKGYRQQIVPLSDLLMSENSLTEARLSYFNTLLQLKNAELEVKKAKGDLLNY